MSFTTIKCVILLLVLLLLDLAPDITQPTKLPSDGND